MGYVKWIHKLFWIVVLLMLTFISDCHQVYSPAIQEATQTQPSHLSTSVLNTAVLSQAPNDGGAQSVDLIQPTAVDELFISPTVEAVAEDRVGYIGDFANEANYPPLDLSSSLQAKVNSLRKETRQNNPSIETLISGLVNLLGGNVKTDQRRPYPKPHRPPIRRPSRPVIPVQPRPSLVKIPNFTSSRLNNRGPSKFNGIRPGVNIGVPARPSTPIRPSSPKPFLVISTKQKPNRWEWPNFKEDESYTSVAEEQSPSSAVSRLSTDSTSVKSSTKLESSTSAIEGSPVIETIETESTDSSPAATLTELTATVGVDMSELSSQPVGSSQSPVASFEVSSVSSSTSESSSTTSIEFSPSPSSAESVKPTTASTVLSESSFSWSPSVNLVISSTPITELEPSISSVVSTAASSKPTGSITTWAPVEQLSTAEITTAASVPTSEIEIITAGAPSIIDITVSNTFPTSPPQSSRTLGPTEPLPRPTPPRIPQRTTPKTTQRTPPSLITRPRPVSITRKPSNQPVRKPSITKLPNPSRPSSIGRPTVIPVDLEDFRDKFKRPGSNRYPNSRPSGNPQVVGSGFSFGEGLRPVRPQSQRPRPNRPKLKTNVPPIRIDTCLVGEDSTCDSKLNEQCRTEQGVSSCVCRPGFARTGSRGPCFSVVSLVASVKIDRYGTRRIAFNNKLLNTESDQYKILKDEAQKAINTAFKYSKYRGMFYGSTVNKFYSIGGKVHINTTVLLERNPKTLSENIRPSLQRELIRVIKSRNQNIGDSVLYVEGPLNPVPGVQDLNECSSSELNDCGKNSMCENTFGTFKCNCEAGYIDKYPKDLQRSGRFCSTCSPKFCNNHGDCVVNNGQQQCVCKGSYIGSKCDIDGEVLGVAVGVSLAAVIIIILTLVCLCSWSKRWKQEQQKIDRASGRTSGSSGNTFTYIDKSSANASAPFHYDDRMRWPDAVNNYYASDPMASQLGGHSIYGVNGGLYPPSSSRPMTPKTGPPPHIDNQYHVPRPRSRTSHAGSLHYDSDYSRDIYQNPNGRNGYAIPLRPIRS